MISKLEIGQYRHTKLFYFLSMFVPWIIWFTVAYVSHAFPNEYDLWTSLGSLIGLLSPLCIALALILPVKSLRNDLIGRFFNFQKIEQRYLIVVFLLMPFSILMAQLVSLFFGYSADQFQFRGGFTFSSGIFPVWFMLVFAPIIEELAWHSYGTDALVRKFSLLKSSLLFALFWGLWHLPLSFIKDYYHSNLVETGLIYSLNFFVSLFPFVLIMNWLYYKCNRNIPVTIIFHISAGFFNEIFATEPMSKVIQTGLLITFSIFLITNNKEYFLRTGKRWKYIKDNNQ
ncbi:CPBP family intramembrane glutamic endopeptidase [Allomuricauda sp. SCSIO 65647]|uniref:CPBP family intramembrane glutamic endopeptidase n=1 Tax=Allomuricauda sp. SCSIO 65647 TaxID=2908843 RepID=UPI001F3059D8|nr:CPBP family intramembrane glutamic endopeptidase [Muricauda sp. SCSIO 65647]UJH66401.1 CPBP family intramembrane metalloprotease [Muricauda sp. SCSIO 65647]